MNVLSAEFWLLNGAVSVETIHSVDDSVMNEYVLANRMRIGK
jgi:hypothetical protein